MPVDDRREFDRRRTADQPWRRWYWTPRWRAISRQQLALHPLCARCLREGRVTPATVCNHTVPHRGDPMKFWSGPFDSLCKPHHDSTQQREEKRGYVIGCDAEGRPLDPDHPWNK